MLACFFKKIDKTFGINKTIRLFRYITFIVISIFFVFNAAITSTGRKVFIIACIGLSCVIVNYLYTKFVNNKRRIVVLLLMETLFNSFILIPSGGLSSPYIWYSLNTILVTAFVLNKEVHCWYNLFIYLLSSTWIFSFLNPQSQFMDILKKESNLILSLILFTGAIQIISRYSKYIQVKNSYLLDINHQLNSANTQIKESINYIMELYQAVHLLTTQSDENNLHNLLVEYAMKMTNAESAFFVINNKITEYSGSINNKEILELKLYESIQKTSDTLSIETIIIDNLKYEFAPIRSNYKIYGFVCVGFSSSDITDKYINEQLIFLSELGTIVLQKFDLEKVNRRLLINEEQNRIANEIHDGVLQKLFSISCGIYGLIRKISGLSKNNITAELSMLQALINNTMSELRATVYGYSWSKDGKNNFLSDVSSYLNTMKKYHDVDIEFEMIGNHQLFTSEQKKIIYRIITEAIGNGIRHGKSEYISISLNISLPNTNLLIADNGTGFNLETIEKENKMGLGIHNIRFLVHSLNGNVQIKSEIGIGTSMTICFPTKFQPVDYRENAI